MLANRSNRHASAFTLIELIVVVLVVLILIGILIPAVQNTRELARRLSCTNNMKQLGLALSSYEAAYRVYPQGANGGLYSAQVMLLPFFEQATLYNSINFVEGGPLGGFANDRSNYTVGTTRLAILGCPSDPDAKTNVTTNYAWNGGFGKQQIDFEGTFRSAATNSVYYIGASSITDGLSNTLAASEWKIGYINSQDNTTVVFQIDVRASENYSMFVQDCLNSSRNTTAFGSWTKDASWFKGFYSATILNFNSLPNSISCWYGSSFDYGNWPCGSYHSEGANTLFHDGHVQYTKSSISISVLQSQSTKSGNDNL